MALAALPLLLYVYMPRPALHGTHLLIYPVLAGTLGTIGALLAMRHSMADRRLIVITVLCLLLASAAGASALLNSAHLRATAPLDMVRPAVLLIFFVYGYYVARYTTEREVNNGLLTAAYLILAGQVLIGALQFVGLSFFDVIYSEQKTRMFGGLLRITGSLGNPNAFGWVVAQASMVIVLLSNRPRRYFVLSLATLLILISGSRSTLIVYPLMIALAFLLRTTGRMKAFLAPIGYALSIAVALVAFLAAFGEHFPYHSQLRSVIETGSLMSVHSFAARVENWQRVYAQFQAAGHTAWWIGLSSREVTRVLDNDFLYVFFRFGAVGFAIHLAILLYTCVLFWQRRTAAVAKLGLQYLCFSILLGTILDTLGGWFFPLLLFYFAGITAGLKRTLIGPNAARPHLDIMRGQSSVRRDDGSLSDHRRSASKARSLALATAPGAPSSEAR